MNTVVFEHLGNLPKTESHEFQRERFIIERYCHPVKHRLNHCNFNFIMIVFTSVIIIKLPKGAPLSAKTPSEFEFV